MHNKDVLLEQFEACLVKVGTLNKDIPSTDVLYEHMLYEGVTDVATRIWNAIKVTFMKLKLKKPKESDVLQLQDNIDINLPLGETMRNALGFVGLNLFEDRESKSINNIIDTTMYHYIMAIDGYVKSFAITNTKPDDNVLDKARSQMYNYIEVNREAKALKNKGLLKSKLSSSELANSYMDIRKEDKKLHEAVGTTIAISSAMLASVWLIANFGRIVRTAVTFLFKFRKSISDHATIQAAYLEMNIHRLQQNPDNEKIINKQTKYMEKFQKIAKKYQLNTEKAIVETSKYMSKQVDVDDFVI